MADPKDYAGYVDTRYLAVAAEHARQDKALSYTAMRVQPGYHVLDVGCGPGSDTITLAGLVGAGCEVRSNAWKTSTVPKSKTTNARITPIRLAV